MIKNPLKILLIIMMSVMMVVNMIPTVVFALPAGEDQQDVQLQEEPQDLQAQEEVQDVPLQEEPQDLQLQAAASGKYDITMQPLQGGVIQYNSLTFEVLNAAGEKIWEYRFPGGSEEVGAWDQRMVTTSVLEAPAGIRIVEDCMFYYDGSRFYDTLKYQASFVDGANVTAIHTPTGTRLLQYSISKFPPLEYVDADENPLTRVTS